MYAQSPGHTGVNQVLSRKRGMGSPLCTRVMKGEVLTWVLRREPGVCTRHVYVCAHVRCRQLITLEDRGVGSCQHSLERESYALEPCGVLAGGSPILLWAAGRFLGGGPGCPLFSFQHLFPSLPFSCPLSLLAPELTRWAPQVQRPISTCFCLECPGSEWF